MGSGKNFHFGFHNLCRGITNIRSGTSIHSPIPTFNGLETIRNPSPLPAQYPTHLQKGRRAPHSHPGSVLLPNQVLR